MWCLRRQRPHYKVLPSEQKSWSHRHRQLSQRNEKFVGQEALEVVQNWECRRRRVAVEIRMPHRRLLNHVLNDFQRLNHCCVEISKCHYNASVPSGAFPPFAIRSVLCERRSCVNNALRSTREYKHDNPFVSECKGRKTARSYPLSKMLLMWRLEFRVSLRSRKATMASLPTTQEICENFCLTELTKICLKRARILRIMFSLTILETYIELSLHYFHSTKKILGTVTRISRPRLELFLTIKRIEKFMVVTLPMKSWIHAFFFFFWQLFKDFIRESMVRFSCYTTVVKVGEKELTNIPGELLNTIESWLIHKRSTSERNLESRKDDHATAISSLKNKKYI